MPEPTKQPLYYVVLLTTTYRSFAEAQEQAPEDIAAHLARSKAMHEQGTDLRTNKTFTLKETPLVRADLDEFVACYKPQNRHERVATWSEQTPNGRWRAYPYEEIMARDKASLDIFWLRDESLDDSAMLPHPSILAAEIVEDLRAALAQFQEIADDLTTAEAAV